MKKLKMFSYITKYGIHSIFAKNILFSIIIIVSLFSMILVHTYITSLNEFSLAAQRLAGEKADASATAYDAAFKTVGELIYSVSTNKHIITAFNATSDNEEYDSIMEYLAIVSNNHKYIKSVNVFIEGVDLLISPTSCLAVSEKNDRLFKEYTKKNTPAFFVYSEKGYSMGDVTFMYKQLRKDGQSLGFVTVRVNIMEFYESLGLPASGNSKDIMLYVNNQNTIITSSRGKLLGKSLKACITPYTAGTAKYDGNVYFTETRSAYLGGKYVCLYSRDLNLEFKTQLSKMIFILLIYALIAGILSAFFIASKSSRPLLDILSYVQKFTDVSYKNGNEVSFITQSISDIENARILSSEEMKKKLMLLNKIQLIAYQNQMNPHFLCNTLETIKWMAFDLETDDFTLSDSIESLSKIAKYSLNSNDFIVTLQTELEYTKTYVRILEMRYPDTLRFEWDIEEGIENIKLVKFCIQPFIENSVQHGMKLSTLPMKIKIGIHTEQNDIIVTVIDSGVGISSEKLAAIRSGLTGHEFQDAPGGVGIFNTNSRIKLVYGGQYGVFIDSTPNCGTIVTLRMNKSI